MDSYVHGWRAMVWGRVWAAVVVLTLAWSVGVGMLLRAVTPHGSAQFPNCVPTAVQPLVNAPVDWLWLPVNAAVAAPFGMYVSGLQFALLAYAVVLIPAARLQQGTARRVLSAPVIALIAAVTVLAGWNFELAAVQASRSLPDLACSYSGF